MTPPDQIPFSSVDRSSRARTTYNRIPELADSIEHNGLIQPIVLVPLEGHHAIATDMGHEYYKNYGLDAGGRRSVALELLLSDGRWDGWLHHATTCAVDPLRPGYVLKGQDESTTLKRLFTEIAENLDRDDMDWRDETALIVKAWKLAQAEHYSKGDMILMRDFGYTLGVGYSKLQASVIIHEDVVANPADYREITSIRGAYALLLKKNAAVLNRELAQRSFNPIPVKVQAAPEPERKEGDVIDRRPSSLEDRAVVVEELAVQPREIPHITLSSAFHNVDSFTLMSQMPDACVDHIYTDPDYAISIDRLAANSTTSHLGVVQGSVTESLSDMERLVREAWRIIKPQGFFVFWYDMDHQEKLVALAESVGFGVQRWPLTWHKTDYRSNASPQSNFPKNEEWAMLCRKPNAILTAVQTTSVFAWPSAKTAREFNHPFAKPVEVHRWILSAIAIKGQTLYDPFMGSASIPVAAVEFGLRPTGSELNPDHYASAVLNLQTAYRKILGTGEVRFS